MTDGFDRSFGAALVTAPLAGVAGVAGSYALAGYTQRFVVQPIAAFLTQNMPDPVLRFAITTLTDIGRQFGMPHLGQQLNLLLALTLGTGLFASLALAALATGRRLQNPFVSAGLAGGLVWLAAAVLTRAPVTALGAGVASGIVVAIAVFAATVDRTGDASVSDGRREVLGSIAGTLGVGVLGYVLGSRGGTGTQGATEAGLSDASTAGDAPTVQEYFAAAEERALDIEGLEGLVSGDDFYVVDIRNIDPNIAPNDWTLSVTGEVEEQLEFTYEDIITMERELRFSTLRCVSDPLNGKLLDNDLWTGVPIMRLIDEANPQGEYVVLRSDDGYYEEFPTDALREGFLAYGKNGGRLPRQHGFPVRALIPGHWGEVSVKWIDEIEVHDRPVTGYWEKRGWHGTGPANTVAKLHATNRLEGRIQVGGHAYAGTRGIQRVEVSTDGGETWNEANLSERLPPGTDRPADVDHAKNAWRQWEYTYEPPGEEHEVVVRAVDGTGTLQKQEDTGRFPNGSSGWVSKTISP